MAPTELIDAIRRQALRFGDFTLASGRKATFYLDCRRVTLDSRSINLVADAMLACCETYGPDAVGGMELGAVPITAALLSRADPRRPLHGFVVRKEAKAYGGKQQIEGPVQPGQRVVIVEDVATTGASARRAVEACRAFGLEVQAVIAIVDRLEGAAECFRELNVPFQALVTVRDLGVEERH